MAFSDIFNFWKKEKEDKHERKADQETVVVKDDGSINISGLRSFLEFQYDNEFKAYTQQVETYRKISELSDVDEAVVEICNEAINFEDEDLNPIELSLEKTDFSENIKEQIVEEFEHVLDLMSFSIEGFEQFKEWYVDGAAVYHKIIDPNNTKKGLIGIRKLDTAKTRKIRNIDKDSGGKIKDVDEYFLFDESAGMRKSSKYDFDNDNVIKFPKESISYVDCGLYDMKHGFPKSHIHKAIRPVNNLISVEVSSVIYRVTRSTEKRVFLIDTGNLQNKQATQYVQDLMKEYRNKVTYNQENGSFSSNAVATNVMEDIWLPRKEGNKGTEVTTLPGGQNLGEMDDVEYMLKKLYRSLNVPISRLNSDALVQIGNIGEIDREELKFSKFIKRLRKRYNALFLDLLQTQLLLKRIITDKEWRLNKSKIKFIYNQDLYISEQKEANMMQERFELADRSREMVGKYFSHDYVRRNILKQTDDDIKDQDKLIQEEEKDPKYQEKEESRF